jgi:two-component system, chemotaxis family, chemotaxis protein CheY
LGLYFHFEREMDHLTSTRAQEKIKDWKIFVKILIVDDDRLSRMLVSRALERAGYGTIQAESVEKAKEVLKGVEPIILIISDLTMPGTDGLSFLAELRSTPSLAELPVLICTAQDPKHWYDAADCLGISGHIAKPLNAQELIERVALVLESAVVRVEDLATVLRHLQISAGDYMDSLKSLEGDLESARASIEGCKAETDLEKLETMLDGLAGSARSLGALRLAPVLKTMSETCRDRDISRIQESGVELLRELRILQSAVEVMRHEQARFKNSSRAGSYSLPMARGLICK